MAFKFVIISCLVALARAGAIPAAVVAEPAVAVSARIEELDAFPQYRFGYSVSDSITGDMKSQTEERNGDLVRGEYSVVDPDGLLRIVAYTADANGYNAVVTKERLVQQAVVAEPAVVAAEPAVVPARIAAAPVLPAPAPALRYVAAPAPGFAPRYTAAYAPAPFGRLAAAPVAYPQQVVAV